MIKVSSNKNWCGPW